MTNQQQAAALRRIADELDPPSSHCSIGESLDPNDHMMVTCPKCKRTWHAADEAPVCGDAVPAPGEPQRAEALCDNCDHPQSWHFGDLGICRGMLKSCQCYRFVGKPAPPSAAPRMQANPTCQQCKGEGVLFGFGPGVDGEDPDYYPCPCVLPSTPVEARPSAQERMWIVREVPIGTQRASILHTSEGPFYVEVAPPLDDARLEELERIYSDAVKTEDQVTTDRSWETLRKAGIRAVLEACGLPVEKRKG